MEVRKRELILYDKKMCEWRKWIEGEDGGMEFLILFESGFCMFEFLLGNS